MDPLAPVHARQDIPIPNLLGICARAIEAANRLSGALLSSIRATIARSNDLDDALVGHQAVAHGCAWVATYVRALGELFGWARRLHAAGKLGELESLLLQAGFAEYLSQLAGGLQMSQGEWFRPALLDEAAVARFSADPAVRLLTVDGFPPPVRGRLARLLAEGAAARRFGNPGFEDSALYEAREQFGRFADEHSAAAHEWHLRDELIPESVIERLGALGVFGLTVAEEHGGAGLGKEAMCVVTEELSRAYIGLGSLGTRSEIAAELVSRAGTEEQKRRLLPGIASGAILPTAAFTEPDFGSDLGSLRTRAVRHGDVYRIHGSKTWTTHGARSDLMTLLARTGVTDGHRGLSMFLVEKPRGTDSDPFPAFGMSGSAIPVLGYRGMKEYEIAFDGCEVPASSLLGGAEGNGFRQLMETFESARIQTAARAVGVAQNAFELALAYATTRRQFDRPIIEFPRIGDKLAWMAVETMIARQLTLFAARRKDGGKRCDMEAGMAKLLAARVAWANADNALQVHGGNGYALEYRISRVFCDARILSIFEGAAEIQANVVFKSLLRS
jgi:(2S)-methylsuccinyl-CoA dehydrogenase